MSRHNNERQWAQLMVVDTQGQLLLTRDSNDTANAWRPAGGELCVDEPFADAAREVLAREAGPNATLGPLLFERREIDSAPEWRERYFLVRHAGEGENETLSSAYRWWSLEAMKRTPAEQFSPAWLSDLLADVLQSEARLPASAARLQAAHDHQ